MCQQPKLKAARRAWPNGKTAVSTIDATVTDSGYGLKPGGAGTCWGRDGRLVGASVRCCWPACAGVLHPGDLRRL